MFLYFHLLDRAFFQNVMVAALADSHRLRSFGTCQQLCLSLCARSPAPPEDALLRQIAQGLPFSRALWQGLVGECLVHGADALPRVPTDPAALTCLLAPERFRDEDTPRDRFAPIQQAHFGTRDLRFGAGYYRPDHAGWNDGADIARLTSYLQEVDTSVWTPFGLAALLTVDEQERVELLEDVRSWWPEFVELYRSAHEKNQIIVCEQF